VSFAYATCSLVPALRMFIRLLRVPVVTLPSRILFRGGGEVGLVQQSKEGEYFSDVGKIVTNDASSTHNS